VLEETAAALAAVRATPEDLQRIEAALTEMVEAGGTAVQLLRAGSLKPRASGLAPENEPPPVRRCVDTDLAFHRAVAVAAHNPFLDMMLEPLTRIVLQQMYFTVFADRFSAGLAEHRRIFTEIYNRNPIGARQAVRRQMRLTLRDLRQGFGEAKLSKPHES
jgi:DNA-binding FadR family transcriptional regulator